MSNRIKLVFVAGPYNAPTHWGIECNIRHAMELGARVVQCGGYPVIPHANTAHFGGLAPEQFYYDGTLEQLRRCDAILLAENWDESVGARRECQTAVELGMPAFYAALESDWEQLAQWVRS